MRERDPIISKVLASAGTQQELAQRIGVTPSALSQWDRVPHLRVLTVERVTGIPRHELRPDLYPPHGADLPEAMRA